MALHSEFTPIEEAVKKFDKSSSEYSKKMITLTNYIIGLTFAMLCAVGVQIGLLIYQVLN